jgi:hypothetical protein
MLDLDLDRSSGQFRINKYGVSELQVDVKTNLYKTDNDNDNVILL